MSRNPQLEAIFEARYAWENSDQTKKAHRLLEYYRLIDEALAKAQKSTREELEEALIEPYRDFRRAKLQEERAKLSRLR
jgi:hypothetical protein